MGESALYVFAIEHMSADAQYLSAMCATSDACGASIACLYNTLV